MTTVALDLLGGDGAPGVVADAAATLLSNAANTGLRLVLVGPVDVARDPAALVGFYLGSGIWPVSRFSWPCDAAG